MTCTNLKLIKFVHKYLKFKSNGFLQVLGNIVVYAVFKISSAIEHNKQTSIGKISNMTANSTTDFYSHCGAADCQLSNVTSEDLDSYVPMKSAVYAFLVCNMVIQCFGVYIHVKFLPDIQVWQINNG